MKDYDAERLQRQAEREQFLGDRSFKFGDEIFVYKANVSYDVLRRLTDTTPLVGRDYIDLVEASVLDLIEDVDDGHARFLALCKKEDSPITFDDLQRLCTDLVDEAFKRPTQASSPSGASDANTGTDSTESSSTEPAAVSAA